MNAARAMRTRSARTLIALAAVLTAAPAGTRPLPSPAFTSPPSPYVMPATQVWNMSSGAGETRRIFLSHPTGDAPEDGYPVLYLLDADGSFAAFAETRRTLEWRKDGQMLIVGIGAIPGGMQGRQVDRLLDFIAGPLQAEIARRFRIDRRRQSLFGHSAAGAAALRTLYTRPDAFHAIVAASPAPADVSALLAEERAFAAKLRDGGIDKVSRLLMVAADREELTTVSQDAHALARRLAPLSAYGLRVRSHAYAGENHRSVPARAVTDTIRFALTWP